MRVNGAPPAPRIYQCSAVHMQGYKSEKMRFLSLVAGRDIDFQELRSACVGGCLCHSGVSRMKEPLSDAARHH